MNRAAIIAELHALAPDDGTGSVLYVYFTGVGTPVDDCSDEQLATVLPYARAHARARRRIERLDAEMQAFFAQHAPRKS